MLSFFLNFFILGLLFFTHGIISHKPIGLLVSDKVVPTLLKDALFTPHLLGYLALGLAGYCILLLCFTALTTWLARAISHYCPLISSKLCSLIALILVFVTVISANTLLFPNSTAAIPQTTAWTFILCFTPLIAGIFIYYSLFLVKNNRGRSAMKILFLMIAVFLAAFPAAAYWPGIQLSRSWASFNSTQSSPESTKPHIILIGIDSLRPDYTSLYGETSVTPEVDEFLENAVAFPETYTPMGRTFPAWVSILTGKYPWEIGVPFNLMQVKPEALSEAFPYVLKTAGYRTFFATDDKHFSNIDESFGFDEVAGPIIGVADFLLGGFNDMALSNLFVNGYFGRMFFPFSHASRPAYVTYDPLTFTRLLSSKLPVQPQQPHFIAIHLCLAHWPFFWKDKPLKPVTQIERKELYESALEASSAQFDKIMQTLKENGYLNNAWVVLLSDHGEGLGEPLNSKEVLQGKGLQLGVDWGHGTSILSTRQHRVVLAFRRYGGKKLQVGIRKQPAIIMDILPTLIDAVGVSSTSSNSDSITGMSLLTAIRDNSIQEQRPIFFETGLNPKGMSITRGKMSANDIQEGMSLYEVNPRSGRLLLKPEIIAREKKDKSYGMMQQGRFLGILAPDLMGNQQIVYKTNSMTALEFHSGPHSLSAEGKAMWQIFQQERKGVVTNR